MAFLAPTWPVSSGAPDLARSPPPMALRHVHVIPSLAMGGAERLVLDAAESISRHGPPPEVAVLHAAAVSYPPGAVPVHALWGMPPRERVARIAALSHETGLPAYCHLTPPAALSALWGAGVATVPVVHNARAGWRHGPEAWRGGNVPFVVACGHAVAVDLVEEGYGGAIRVVRHAPRPRPPLDEGRRARLRLALGCGDGTVLVGMVGRLAAQKRHWLAVRIVAGLARGGHDARLAIVGAAAGLDGVEAAELVRAEAARLGVADRVLLVGAVADAGSLSGAFDVHLNCSTHEGVSIATMDAVAAGVPTVSSDVGGQREALAPGDGLVPSEAPVRDWVDAVEAVLRGPRERLPEAVGLRHADAQAMLWPWLLATREFRATRRVLFVTGNLDVGGAQRSLCNLLAELGARRRDVACAVVGAVGVPAFMRPARAAGVSFFDASGGGGLAGRVGRLLAIVRDGGFGRVVFWNMDAATKLLLTKALEGSPVRVGDVSPGPALFSELDGAELAARAFAMDADSYLGRLDPFVAKYPDGAVPHSRARPKAERVVPNGVPSGALVLLPGDGPRPPLGFDADKAVLVVGRFAPSKMPEAMPAIARALADEVPGASLTLVGGVHGAKGRESFADMLAAAGGSLPPNMFVAPPDDRARGFMPRFAALLLLSRDQGCPNASLEAMASGLPVVANDDGGVADQVVDGYSGLLVRDDDGDFVAPAVAALARVIRDPKLAAVLAAGGKALSRGKFSMSAMADGYESALGMDGTTEDA